MGFNRSALGKRFVVTAIYPPASKSINSRYESIRPDEYFAKQTINFHIPSTFEIKTRSFILGKDTEIELKSHQENMVNLAKTKSFLQQTFELYQSYANSNQKERQ